MTFEQELLDILNQIPPTIEKAFTAWIQRHPGHGSQKVHGNRYGGFSTTKESLRRLKGDKEARERYKQRARERGKQDSDRTVDKAASNWYLKQKEPRFDHPNNSLGGYTITQARDNFDKVSSRLEEKTGISTEVIKEYTIDWGKQGGHKEKYQQLQKAADNVLSGKTDNSEAGKLLGQVYADTQSELGKAGIKEVVLYRGESGKRQGGLTSWTIDPKVAANYAANSGGKVVRKKIPAKNIVSTPFTGIGNLSDYEFVVNER